MVNNSGFEGGLGCCQMDISNNTIDCWYWYRGTPDIYANGCFPPTTPATTTYTSSSSRAMGVFGGGGTDEAVQTQLNAPLIPFQNYVLSFWARTMNSPGFPEVNCSILFYSFPNVIPGNSFSGYSFPISNYIPDAFELKQTLVPKDLAWHYYSVPFTFNGLFPHNALGIINNSNQYGYNQNYIYIDDVTIKPVNQLVTLNLPSVACNTTTITDLSTFLSPPTPGGVFSGPGVGLSGGVYSFTPSIAGLGTHNIIYTYSVSGCPVTIASSITVSDGSSFTVSANATPTAICLSNTSTLTVTGATTYTWNPGALTGASVTVSPTSTTVYTVIGSVCSNTVQSNVTVSVTSSPSPTLSISPSSPTICLGDNPTLTVTGATTYSWSTGATTNTVTVYPSVTTPYSVIGTSTAGCVATATSIVTVAQRPSLTITASLFPICSGQSSTLTASGATNYTWNPGGLTGSSITVSPTVTTTYTLTGTAAASVCPSTQTITLIVNPTPSVSVSNPTICSGNSSTLSASGITSYSWNTGANTNFIVVTPSITTSYTVNSPITGCSRTVSVTVNTTPTVAVSNVTICSGTSTVLTASGASTYTWDTGATTNTISVTPTVTTVYTVTGVSNNCTNTKTVSVTVTPNPTVSVSSTTICAGKTATLSATGATTYSWDTGATTSSIVVSPTSTTNYTVTGTSGVCANTKTVSVNVNPLPTVTAVANPTSICVGQTATLTAGGATTYSWSTTSTNTVITVTPSVTTTYTAYGFFANGCSSTKTVSVIVGPVTPTITASSSPVNVCSGNTATLTATGAINYTWSPISVYTATASITPSVATIYILSGSSGTGCNTATTTIVVNPVISTLCCSAATSTVGTSLTSTVYPVAGSYSTSTAVVYVQGVVTFTNNTSYTGYVFRMAPGASLRVYPNKTLTLTNCKLYSCSELWDGIYLLNDRNYYNGNIIVNNSTLEDMYNGIVLDYENSTLNPSVPSGTIALTGSTFNKNYVSVQMKNNPNGYLGGATNNYLLSVKTTTFSSNASATSPSSTLKPSSTYTYAYNTITNGTMGSSAPYLNFPRAFMGIYFDNLKYSNFVVVGDNAVGSNTNTFDNMDFGINGTNSSVKVYNNHFKNITGSLKQGDLSAFPPSYPAAGPNEIGIAVALTGTATGNYYQAVVGDHTTVPSGGNPFPRGNIFEDCNKGIAINNMRYITAKANYFTATTTSTAVVTTCCGGLPIANPNTYYYYKAQNAEFITAIGTTADLSFNYIRNHATGIYANHTIVSGGVTPALDITDNDIAAPSSTGYCMQAIQVDQSGGINFGTDKLNIYNNRIENVYRGIIANSVANGLLIKSNGITVESTAKTLNYAATQARTGVSLNSCEYANVKGNNFTQNGSVPTTSVTANYINGAFLTNSKNGKIECNNATGLGRCFVFQQNCSGSSWKVNDMSNSYTGLELRIAGVIGFQGAPLGTPNLSANTWTNITQQTYAVSSPSVNQTSKLYVLAGATTQPTLNFASGAGVNPYSIPSTGINMPGGTSYTCNAGSAQRLMNDDDNAANSNGNNMKTIQEADTLMLYTLLATQDEEAYEIFAEEMTYHNKQAVFKLLKEDSIQAVGGTLLDKFYQEQQNSPIDKLTQVQQAIAVNDIANAQAVNASVGASNSIEYKHQRTNELLLLYMQNHLYQFSSAELSDLYTMANECVAKGYYVTQCRNIVNAIQNTVVEFADNCDEEANASRKIKQTATTIQAQMYFAIQPNPNNGEMLLMYNLGNYANANVDILDITGKVIQTYTLNTNVGNLIINEPNMSNGIYFYRIFTNNSILKTDKIVIIK